MLHVAGCTKPKTSTCEGVLESNLSLEASPITEIKKDRPGIDIMLKTRASLGLNQNPGIKNTTLAACFSLKSPH